MLGGKGPLTHEDVDRLIAEVEADLLPIVEELNPRESTVMRHNLEEAKDHTLPILTRLSLVEMALRAAAYVLGVDFNELWEKYGVPQGNGEINV